MSALANVSRQNVPACYFAICFLPLWTLFVINTQSTLRNTGEIENMVLIITGVYLSMRLATDIATACFGRNIRALSKHAVATAGSPICMILGTVLITCVANGWVGGTPLLIFGSALCGLGGELMLLIWLELFINLDYRDVKRIFVAMLAAGAVASPMLLFVPTDYLFIGSLALPILSAFGYHRSNQHAVSNKNDAELHWHKPSFKGLLSIGIGVASLYFGFHFLQSGFQGLLLEENQGHSIEIQAAILGRWFALAVVCLTIRNMKDFHYESMFKTAGIIGIAAFLILPLPVGGFLAFCVLTIIACFLVDYATSLATVSIARFSEIPSLIILGIGRSAICIGGVFGVLAGSSLATMLSGERGGEFLTLISALAVLLIAFSSIWLLREQAISSFLWTRGTAPDSPSPAKEKRSVSMACAFVAKKHSLTAREEQILNLLVAGRNAPYISEALYISPDTVRSHIRHIYQKLGVHNRQDLLTVVQEKEIV